MVLEGAGDVPVPGMVLEFPGTENGAVGPAEGVVVMLKGYLGAVDEVIVALPGAEDVITGEPGVLPVPVPGGMVVLPGMEKGAVGTREVDEVMLNG